MAWLKPRTTPAPPGPRTARAEKEVVKVTHDAPRRQRTPHPGERPGIPWSLDRRGVTAAGGILGDGMPTLALPSRARLPDAPSAGGAEVAEEAAQARDAEAGVLLDIPAERRSAQQKSRIHLLIEILDQGEAGAAAASSSSQPGRRKRKKRRKRRGRGGARLTLQTRKLWLVGVATDRDVRYV